MTWGYELDLRSKPGVNILAVHRWWLGRGSGEKSVPNDVHSLEFRMIVTQHRFSSKGLVTGEELKIVIIEYT